MNLHTTSWQVVVSVVGVLAQLAIAYFSRRQLARHSSDTLDMQRLVSHRATASFVADKRQKWIDELRTDMAFHLALSQEIVWKWDAARSKSVRLGAQEINNPNLGDQRNQEIADDLSKEIGAKDRDHQERHIRIKLRLNPNEANHVALRGCLDDIREILRRTQLAPDEKSAKQLIWAMESQIATAVSFTEQILKTEWTRVKQEVAYPELLMASISKPINSGS